MNPIPGTYRPRHKCEWCQRAARLGVDLCEACGKQQAEGSGTEMRASDFEAERFVSSIRSIGGSP